LQHFLVQQNLYINNPSMQSRGSSIIPVFWLFRIPDCMGLHKVKAGWGRGWGGAPYPYITTCITFSSGAALSHSAQGDIYAGPMTAPCWQTHPGGGFLRRRSLLFTDRQRATHGFYSLDVVPPVGCVLGRDPRVCTPPPPPTNSCWGSVSG
jgi:hypothetical protein